jgi:hypothetical protein
VPEEHCKSYQTQQLPINYLLNEMRVIKIAATATVPKVITLFIMQKIELNCHLPALAKKLMFADVTKIQHNKSAIARL